MEIKTNSKFLPGLVWKDNSGEPIQAHGGGILFHDGMYYWYGENKAVETTATPAVRKNGERFIRYQTELAGISCYSSRDLLHWTNEGLALPAVADDPDHDLHTSKVLERPKVVYHDATRKFVMWMHAETRDYQYARAGVAVSDSPSGPFEYLGSCRPNDAMSRDMTLFKDDDGKAYLLFSSENNSTLHVCLLSDDYLRPTAIYTRNFVNQYREAPAMFKHESKYYLITSGCTGWDPNQAQYAVAASPLGPWETAGNPCSGENAELTFNSQSTHVLRLEGREHAFIFLADRWKKDDLGDSRYVWLPLHMEDGKPVIQWLEEWDLNWFSGGDSA
ncbi:glycoside hydrolase family 43 protein [Paenibacillus sp. HB172176]|uniref:glycoside hydrolase family 43 protein n=1 Tax=Paenibacillus sp. HB172176 TaxID=2493690 RepID=UPI0019811B8F|nr:glycoside hydrolase family 43 protein [Paenibacillus sp. HB172176]